MLGEHEEEGFTPRQESKLYVTCNRARILCTQFAVKAKLGREEQAALLVLRIFCLVVNYPRRCQRSSTIHFELYKIIIVTTAV